MMIQSIFFDMDSHCFNKERVRIAKLKAKHLLIIALILSVIVNIYFFQQLRDKEQAQFEKVQKGVEYAYRFGDILQRKYKDLSQQEKSEYVTAIHWSLELSTYTLETVEPEDERYRELGALFGLYGTTELGRLLESENGSDEEALILMETWLTDMNYLTDKLNNDELHTMSYRELREYWTMLLNNLKLKNEYLIKYKAAFITS